MYLIDDLPPGALVNVGARVLMTAAEEQVPKICEVTGLGYEEMTERWKEKEGYTRGKAKEKNFKEELEDAFEDPRI